MPTSGFIKRFEGEVVDVVPGETRRRASPTTSTRPTPGVRALVKEADARGKRLAPSARCASRLVGTPPIQTWRRRPLARSEPASST